MESQIGSESFPFPSLPYFTASLADPNNSSRHTTVASLLSQESSQTVPHFPSWLINRRPSKGLLPPTSLIWVSGGPLLNLSLPQLRTHVLSVRQNSSLQETFRFQDEYDYEYEIFSILSSVRAWTSVILAGKRGSRRHSTTSFRANVVVAKTRYQMLEVFLFCDRESAYNLLN